MPLEWQTEKVCDAFVIWMSASCSCRQLPNVIESARYRDSTTLPAQTPNLQTDVRTRSVVCVWELHRSRNSFVIQSRDNFDFVPCLCVTLAHMRRNRHDVHIMSLDVSTVVYVATAIKFWANLDVDLILTA